MIDMSGIVMKKVWFILTVLAVVIAGCEHQGNNPLEENPLEGYTVLQADDDNVHLRVYEDTVKSWSLIQWSIDAVDSAGREYTVDNDIMFYSVVTDVPSHLDVAYGNKEVLLIYMYGHMAGENPDYADIIARSGSMKVLKHEGDYYELEYKFTMQNKVKYYLLYKGEMTKYMKEGEYFE